MEMNSNLIKEEPILEPKTKSNKALIITLVILVVLAIVGIGGTWYYMNQQLTQQKDQNQAEIEKLNKKLSELEATANAKKDEVTTKSYKTKYELLNFSYPNNFTLNDTSRFIDQQNAGLDELKLASSDGFEIRLMAGAYGIGGACPECTVLFSEPITILGKQYYLNYVQNSSNGQGVNYIVVTTNKDDTFGGFDSKNIKVGSDKTATIISAGYSDRSSSVVKDLSSIQSDPNVQAYKNFLTSLSY